MKFCSVLMGSDSDYNIMHHAVDILKSLGIIVEVEIASAHRTPEYTKNYVADAEQRGCVVFIAGAGMAAHLAGAVASQTVCPVIAVPLASGMLSGLDALLATVQMPAGIPVACQAVGKAGAKNAAYLAAQILAVHDNNLKKKLLAIKTKMADEVILKNKRLKEQLIANAC